MVHYVRVSNPHWSCHQGLNSCMAAHPGRCHGRAIANPAARKRAPLSVYGIVARCVMGTTRIEAPARVAASKFQMEVLGYCVSGVGIEHMFNVVVVRPPIPPRALAGGSCIG